MTAWLRYDKIKLENRENPYLNNSKEEWIGVFVYKMANFNSMEALKKNHNRIIKLKQAKKIIIILIAAMFFEFVLFPMPSLAAQAAEVTNQGQEQGIVANAQNDINQVVTTISIAEFNGKLPENGDVIRWSNHFVVTAYNSDAGQTDDSPCITANNFNVCSHGIEDTIAANFLPFGAKVRIPELFGDKVFVVRDRMNKRFSNRVDVWMLEKPDAINFGVKVAKIQVLKF